MHMTSCLSAKSRNIDLSGSPSFLLAASDLFPSLVLCPSCGPLAKLPARAL